MIKFILLISLFFSTAFAQAQFTYIGKGSNAFHYANPYIKLKQDTMYVPSDNGLYKKNVLSVDTLWIPAGFQGKKINDYLLIGLDTILAAVDSTEGNTIFISTDNGAANTNITNGFGGTGVDFQPCTRLDYKRENHNELIGMSGMCVARSVDFSASWIPVYSSWGYTTYQSQVLRYHPFNSNCIYAGGELSLFDSYLAYTFDNSASWNTSAVEINNAVNCIAFYPADSNIIFLGKEGRIARSNDKGVTWNEVYLTPHYEYVYAITFNESNPSIMYAGGAVNGTNDTIRLFMSTDTGLTWTEWVSQYIPEAGGIKDLIMIHQALYILAFSGRVYKFNHISLSTDDIKSETAVAIFPNPVSDWISIRGCEPNFDEISYGIFDVYGKKVTGKLKAEEKINCSNLSPGFYMLHLEGKKSGNSVVRFIKK